MRVVVLECLHLFLQILTQHDLERAVSNIEATLGDVQKDWEQRTSAVSVRREGGGRKEKEGKEGRRRGVEGLRGEKRGKQELYYRFGLVEIVD